MNALAQKIDQKIKENGWQQKQLALEWHERVGNGSVTTYITKLSKLIKGDKEGIDFLLGEVARVAALAGVLEITEDELRALAETTVNRPTLVLDPRLPEPQRIFLLKRQQLSPEAFACVEIDNAGSNGQQKETIRDAAKKAPNAIVVVCDGRDDDFYRGAELQTSTVEAATPGFKLAALPDLIQPLAPKLHDDDGMPMVPEEELESWYRERMGRRRYGHEAPLEEDNPYVLGIRQADTEGRRATFRLDARGDYGRPKPEEVVARVVREAFERAFPKNAKSDKRTWFWCTGASILALGTASAATAAFAEFHTLHYVSTFEPIVESLAETMKTLSPYADGGSLDLSGLLAAFEEETGLLLQITMQHVREALSAMRMAGGYVEATSSRRSTEDDEKARALIDDLLQREIELPSDDLSTIFVLQAIRRAPLLHLGSSNGAVSVVANLGAGNLATLTATRYAGEQPTPLRAWKSDERYARSVYDAGDVRFTLSHSSNSFLEGDLLPSVARRREREAAARDDD